jgi:uncharacterized coiled-coil protein SlyX
MSLFSPKRFRDESSLDVSFSIADISSDLHVSRLDVLEATSRADELEKLYAFSTQRCGELETIISSLRGSLTKSEMQYDDLERKFDQSRLEAQAEVLCLFVSFSSHSFDEKTNMLRRLSKRSSNLKRR